MKQIEFIASGANTMIGGFATGDIARVADDLAKHLVEEAGVAKYHGTAQAAAPVDDPVAPADEAALAGGKGKKAK